MSIKPERLAELLVKGMAPPIKEFVLKKLSPIELRLAQVEGENARLAARILELEATIAARSELRR